MSRRIAFALLAVAAASMPRSAGAQIDLFANLTNSQETALTVPTLSAGGPRATSFGNATFQLNAAGTQLSFLATIYNIDVTGTQTADVNDNLTAAHIHVGAFLGANAGVRWGFFGAPLNNNNPSDGGFTPFASGVGGTFSGTWDAPEGNNTTLAAQLAGILGGQAYINFHTTQFAGGEIRGQIAVVPEPETVALTAAGLALLALMQKRRRSRRNADA